MSYRLRTQFKVPAVSLREAGRFVGDLQRELTDRPWILRPQVQWNDAQQTVLVAFETPVESDTPAEPPVLLQTQQLRDCLRSCTGPTPFFEWEDSLIVER